MEPTSTTTTEHPQEAPQSSGGRGRGQKPRNDRGQKPQWQYAGPKGAIEDLKDNVYIVGDARQADKYNKTTEAILAYIQANYEEGMDVVNGLTKLAEPDFDKWKPKAPKAKAKATTDTPAQYDKFEEQLHLIELKEWVARKNKYRMNMDKAFAVLFGQCSMATKNKLESRKDWTTIKDGNKAIDLLKAIKEVTQDYQDNKYPLVSVKRTLLTVLTIKQDEREGIVSYTKRFRSAVEVMEAQQGTLALTEYVTKMKDYEVSDHEAFESAAYDSFIALCYLDGCSKAKSLLKDLANAYAMGHDNYPKTLNDAIAMASNYQGSTEKRTGPRPDHKSDVDQPSVGFAQKGKQVRKITCYNCGKEGHYANECPNPRNTQDNDEAVEDDEGSESQSTRTPTTSNVFMQAQRDAQRDGSGVGMHATRAGPHTADLKNKILLDSESTNTVFCNAKFVTNIRESKTKLKMWTLGGHYIECTKQADVNGYPYPVWFNPEATTNIVSFSEVEKTPEWFKIEYEPGTFKLVNKVSKRITLFRRNEAGLYAATPTTIKVKATQAKTAGVDGGTGNPKYDDEWKLVTSRRSKHPRSGWTETKSNERKTGVLSNRRHASGFKK